MTDFNFEDFSIIDIAVEATSFERYCLWGKNNEKYKWKQQTIGTAIKIGQLDNMSIFISLSFAKINDYNILFYYPSSVVVDWRIIDKWKDDALKNAKFTDAQNFHIVGIKT